MRSQVGGVVKAVWAWSAAARGASCLAQDRQAGRGFGGAQSREQSVDKIGGNPLQEGQLRTVRAGVSLTCLRLRRGGPRGSRGGAPVKVKGDQQGGAGPAGRDGCGASQKWARTTAGSGQHPFARPRCRPVG